jgi:hypothetical protein
MIIDFRTHRDHASRFDVLDAATGENLNRLGIFYADDVRGVFFVYRRGPSGRVLLAGTEPAWEEHRRRIRIVPKGAARPSAFDPGHPDVFRFQKQEADAREFLREVAEVYGESPPPELAEAVRTVRASLDDLATGRLAARQRAADAKIAAGRRQIEEQARAEVKARAREKARARAVERRAEDRSRAEDVRRAREAYEAACDLRRAGIEVGHAVSIGRTSWSVPGPYIDRRRRGRLPHEEEPSFDDVVRLLDR